MAYNFEIKVCSLAKSKKSSLLSLFLKADTVNQQKGRIFNSVVSKGMLTEKELWEKL